MKLTNWEKKQKDHYNRHLSRKGLQSYYKDSLDFQDKLLGDIRKLRILDIGCGSGYDSCRFVTKGAEVTCLDISERLLDSIRFRCKKVCDTAEDLTQFKDTYFDVVFCRALLHHLRHPKKCLKEINRILKPSGKTVIIEPLANNFLLNLGRKWRNKYDNRLEDQHPFKISELKHLFFKTNFTNTSFKPFYSYFLLLHKGIDVLTKRYTPLNFEKPLFAVYNRLFSHLDKAILFFKPTQGWIMVCYGEKK